MGSHSWVETCPSCGYAGMEAYDCHGDTGTNCPICGYRTWTERQEPDQDKVELAKKLISTLSEQRIQDALERHWYDDSTPLIEVAELVEKVK